MEAFICSVLTKDKVPATKLISPCYVKQFTDYQDGCCILKCFNGYCEINGHRWEMGLISQDNKEPALWLLNRFRKLFKDLTSITLDTPNTEYPCCIMCYTPGGFCVEATSADKQITIEDFFAVLKRDVTVADIDRMIQKLKDALNGIYRESLFL